MRPKYFSVDQRLPSSCFSSGETQEVFFLIQSTAGLDFQEAASQVLSQLEAELAEIGSSHANTVFSRAYLGDIARQKNSFYETRLFWEISQGAVSLVGQTPLEGGPLSLFCYQVISSRKNISRTLLSEKTGESGSGIILDGNYRTLWFADQRGNPSGDVARQTTESLDALSKVLNSAGMDWAEHVLRTWIFVHDIDHHYDDMVKARLEYFSRHGLTARSRFPASTGIGARLARTGGLVGMECMAMQGFAPGQIQVMTAGCMPPAMSYGVSFERGLKVRFGDRTHYHISGTASIGRSGEILHPCDLERQTAQAMENVKELLVSEGASLTDLAYLLVYVRDASSALRTRSVLSGILPETVPSFILEGAVCRPGWLVEVEGLAIQSAESEFKDFL